MQQSGFAQYPRPPVREIDFGVISEGFNVIWRNLGPFLLASFCGIILPAGLSQAASFGLVGVLGPQPSVTDPKDIGLLYAYIGRQYVFMMPVNIVASILAAPFWYAIVAMTLKVVKGQPLEAGDAFCGFQKFGKVAGLMLLMQLFLSLSSLLCCLPMFVVGGLLMFSFPTMVDKDATVGEAMRSSLDLLKDHWLMAALFYFVIGLCSGLGFIACCIGLFVTVPLLYVCPTLVYRDFTMGRGFIPAPEPTGEQQ